MQIPTECSPIILLFPIISIIWAITGILPRRLTDDNFAGALKLPLLGQGAGSGGISRGFFSGIPVCQGGLSQMEFPVGKRRGCRNISQFFHVLDGVAMVRGSVITESGAPDIARRIPAASTRTGRLLLQDLRKPSDTGGGHEQ